MASMGDIRRRRDSIQNTQQITRAMKLVATAKLQRARANVQRFQDYFQAVQGTVTSILSRASGLEHPYLRSNAAAKKAVILISSDRGLAGGYNANLAKKVLESGLSKEETRIYAVGRKGKEILQRNGYTIQEEWSEMTQEPSYTHASTRGGELLSKFEVGEIGEIYLAYTRFHNTVSQEPVLIRLLPVEDRACLEKEETGPRAIMNFEPVEEEVLDRIIPQYINALIYGGLLEAAASENGARMQAMDSATGNAEEMIEDLTVSYNRARQSSITQELTEIIAGAEAIS